MRKCSRCKKSVLPPEDKYKWKQCQKCRDYLKAYRAKRSKKTKEDTRWALMKKRKEVTISREFADRLGHMPCVYCSGFSNDLKLNGIDRVCSDEGYTRENTVSCCRRCNTMKMDMPLREFMDRVRALHLRFRDLHSYGRFFESPL